MHLSRLTHRFVVFSLTVFMPIAPAANGLPEMTPSEVVKWSRTNPAITPLQLTKKYEPGYSDYDSEAYTSGGSVHFTVFLSKDELVESEGVDYRPWCSENADSDCYGDVRFEQAGRSNGKDLIAAIWGQTILDDFLKSRLIATDSNNSTKRWYQGKLYNYETSHYENYTISHFNIVSKKSPQPERIKMYRYCLRNYC